MKQLTIADFTEKLDTTTGIDIYYYKNMRLSIDIIVNKSFYTISLYRLGFINRKNKKSNFVSESSMYFRDTTPLGLSNAIKIANEFYSNFYRK